MNPAENKAVFLSYASQDAAAVARIAEALRAAGVEVWFDRNELVGGDAWDAKIRKQIKDCALFVPLISAATQARAEGYFRREWKLAVDRTHDMADHVPFLVPVVLDDTPDAGAFVPEKFREVQWTRLRPVGFGGQTRLSDGGQAPDAASLAAFCARVGTLLGGGAETPAPRAAVRRAGGAPASGRRRPSLVRAARWAACVIAVGAAWWLWRSWPGSGGSAGERQPAPARELVAKARLLIEREDDSNREIFRIAEDLLVQAEKLDPFDGEVWAAHAQLSGMLRSLGYDNSDQRREDLRRQAERAIKLAPDSPESQLAWARFLASPTTTLPEAATAAQALIKRLPGDGRPLMLMAEIAERQGKREEAIDWFRRAAAVPDTAAVAQVELATLLFLAGRIDEAERAVDAALAIRPLGRALLLKIRGQVLWQGDLDGAMATVEKVPPSLLLEDRGAFNAFRVWFWRREPERALALLQGISRDFLSDSQFTGPKAVLVATAQQQAGRPELARSEWELALRLIDERLRPSPGQSRLLYLRTLCLAELGRTAEAEEALRAFRQTGNSGMQMWPGGGLPGLLLRLGRPAEAMDIIEQEQAGGLPLFNSRAVLGLNPAFAALRGDARFQRILARAPGPAGSAAGPAADTSVAVLPFANLSGDAAQEYFSDGLTEEILNALAREPDLRVPGRTSSFSFKGKNAPAAEIARALNVTRLVEGSVRKAGNRVRISVSLTRGSDGFSEDLGTFTEELGDIFALQDKVARAVVEKLTQRAAPARPTVALTKNPEAYDLYLKAHQVFFRGDLGGFKEAIALAEAAVALDPGYASAVFTLAAGHSNIVRRTRNSSEPKTLAWHAAEARRWAEAAARLDPAGLGPSAQAIYHGAVRRDYPRALAQADLALRARANDIATHTFRAWSLLELGRTAEALEAFRAATVGDPLNPFSLGNEAWAATLLRRTREAAAALARAEAGAGKKGSEWRGRFVLTGELPVSADGFSPSDLALWLWRSRRFAELAELAARESTGADVPAARFWWRLGQHDALRRLGRTGEAEGVARELAEIAPALEDLPDSGPPLQPGLLAKALVRAGRAPEAMAAAKRYLEAAPPDRHLAERWRRETELAELHAYLGEPAACVALVAKLLREPSGLTVPMLKADPVWDNVREDPAFKALLADPKNSAPL